MFTDHKSMRPITERMSSCSVCGNDRLAVLFEMPGLPLTGIYCRQRQPDLNDAKGIDQSLLFCGSCGHAQLGVQVSSEILYGNSYSFRTSESTTARQGSDFFLAMLDDVAPGRRFRCILDVGCNDLYLLDKLKDRASARVGIDPVWSGKEDLREDHSIRLIGSAVENLDLPSVLPVAPDLIVCRHTMEHIGKPMETLKAITETADKEALFLIEVPDFSLLVHRFRFDQVFHQHLQYFSLFSFLKLIGGLGGTYISHRHNEHHWGALLIAFGKSGLHVEKTKRPPNEILNIGKIESHYEIFRRQLKNVNHVLESLSDTLIYGYGASQMLPILAYHLGNDLSSFEAVLDDDPGKQGWSYWNLPVGIRKGADAVALEKASVVITALDSIEPIMRRLMVSRPRNIVIPLHLV